MPTLIHAIHHLTVTTERFDDDVIGFGQILGREPASSDCEQTPRSAVFEVGNVRVHLTEHDHSGLAELCFAVADISRMARRLKRLGLPGALDGASTLTLSSGDSRGLSLSFTECDPGVVPATSADDTGVIGLDHVVIESSHAESTGFLLGAQLGLDMRLDLSNQDWGARLMFFRCGDLIVEVYHPLNRAAANTQVDNFFGLSWRVRDAEATRQRLADLGRDVSEVRAGRKPGTRVFTLRDTNAGVPSLFVQPHPAK